MDLVKAEKLIDKLLHKTFNINGQKINLIDRGWKFKGFDRSTRRLGICFMNKKEIGLSKIQTSNRVEDGVKNTILHEIAHSLDYEIRGDSDHSYIWKNIAKQIGCSGERCTDLSSESSYKKPEYKYLAVCPIHGVLGGWNRKPKSNKICKKCHSVVKIELQYFSIRN